MRDRGPFGFPLSSPAIAQVVDQSGQELVSLEAAYGYAYFLLKSSWALLCRGIPHHGKADEWEKADVPAEEGRDPHRCNGKSQSQPCPPPREDPTAPGPGSDLGDGTRGDRFGWLRR